MNYIIEHTRVLLRLRIGDGTRKLKCKKEDVAMTLQNYIKMCQLRVKKTYACTCSWHGPHPWKLLERRRPTLFSNIIGGLISQILSYENLILNAFNKIQSLISVYIFSFILARRKFAYKFIRWVAFHCRFTCILVLKTSRIGGSTVTEVAEKAGGCLSTQRKLCVCALDLCPIKTTTTTTTSTTNGDSLLEAMDKFFKPEVLDGSNKYRCERCKKLVQARKQMSIMQAPKVLVIQLKRFEGVLGNKIDRMIKFEEVLVLSSYMCRESQDPHPEYNLFGTIVHSGFSPESGHYYAYIKDTVGRWFCCNDSYVSLSSLQDVLSEKVYILFFSRTNQRPMTAKTTSTTDGVKSFCNDGNALSDVDSTPQLIAAAANTHDASYSVEDVLNIPKKRKVTSSPQIKFGEIKAFDSKKLNGNGNIPRNGSVVGHVDLKESRSIEKGKKETQLVINNDKSSSAVFHDCKQKTLSPHANGKKQSNGVKSLKTAAFDDDHSGHKVTAVRYPDSANVRKGECKSNISFSGSKRKSANDVPYNILGQDDHQEKLKKFKQILSEDASSTLRSCGWHDQVHSFMLAKKKLRDQSAGNSTDYFEFKKILIAEARKTFISQVPESLKEHLVGRLKLFSQGKPFLDA
ncbi:hypothetical protein Sjap_026371 [Stephania japonica]|uniref:ubiquitinyl hydrolase 1 n=1 Tax=Stephania japonica TaxID=461633 RepID=A0AAP0E3E1_9MAGN